ncbi:hypothetical protein [Aquimarina algiphila]|uniref:hypothetical protein n=1 Tax=Aquimarina algiphila TaxID=2047982 RepID=UPI00232CB729|nr:hypothetical protein [Aquimarina algiphila]
MKFVCVFSLFIIVCSCNTTPSQVNLSANEKVAIDSIASIYGGNISYYKGVTLIGNDKNSHFFQINLDESSVLPDFNEFKYLPPSNIASIFYSLISQKEKEEYNKYKISVNYAGDLKEYEYSREKLSTIVNCAQKTKFIIKLLKDENYSILKSSINIHPLFKFDLDILLRGIKRVNENYGQIKNSTITGFTFHNVEDHDFNFIKIYGFFEREKQNNLFSIFIDPKTKNVFKIEYEW